jgi:selenide,water dikinase
MLQLNGEVSRFFKQVKVNAVTDITGFGLIAHAFEMARASDVTLQFDADSIPILEGTRELAEQKMLPGGIKSNESYVGQNVVWTNINTLDQEIFQDPQTSGGLLISLPQDEAGKLHKLLIYRGLQSYIVGRVVSRKEYYIEVRG